MTNSTALSCEEISSWVATGVGVKPSFILHIY